MHCLIDLTYIKRNSFSGVAVFAFRLVRGLVMQNKRDQYSVLVNKQDLSFIKEQNLNCNYIVLDSNYEFIINKIPHLNGLINKKQIDRIIKSNKIDIFFSPFFSYKTYIINAIPHIAFMHDAQTFIIKKGQKIKGLIYRITMLFLIDKLTKILTSSEHSKIQIKDILPNIKCPIEVIYDSVEMQPVEQYSKSNIYKPYILNVNTLHPYKNLITLVEAFNILKDKFPHTLVVKGEKLPYWDNVIWPYIIKHSLEKRIVLIEDRISDGMLTNLYTNAELFVSPSLMEGFGFTPIEAAICETPVICSKEGALPETTMNMLNYYEPALDSKVLAKEIEKILTKEKDPIECKKIAETFKETYSIKSQGTQLLNIFQKTLSKELSV